MGKTVTDRLGEGGGLGDHVGILWLMRATLLLENRRTNRKPICDISRSG